MRELFQAAVQVEEALGYEIGQACAAEEGEVEMEEPPSQRLVPVAAVLGI